MSEILSLKDIQKSGNIAATDVAFNGDLTPKQGRTFVNAIKDNSGFLKLITVDTTSGLTKTRTAYDVAEGILTRHVSGSAPDVDKMQKLETIGCALDMSKGVELNARILDETLIDNKDNTKFEQEKFEEFAKAFSNDLVNLGFVGKSDTRDKNANFEDLAKGWITVAKEANESNKVEANRDSSVLSRLKAIIKELHPQIQGGRAVIMVGNSDYDQYQWEVSDKHPNSGAMVFGGINSVLGYKIMPIHYMPAGTMLATVLPNMVLGLATKIKKVRWYDNETSSLRFKYVAHPDYEFDIHKYVTVLTTNDATATS